MAITMTKTSRKITVILLIVVLIFFTATYVFFRIRGKELLTERLSEAFGRPVQISGFRFAFPFGFRVDGLKIEELLASKRVYLQISAASFLSRNLHFYSLRFVEPVLYVQRTRDSKIILGNTAEEQKEHSVDASDIGSDAGSNQGNQQAAVAADKDTLKVIINRLRIQKGKLEFLDRSSARGDFGFIVEDINLSANSVTFPAQSKRMRFKFVGSFGGYKALSKGGQVRGQGWTNFAKKNMEAAFKVIDKEGNVGLSADLISHNNDMQVSGKLQIQNLVFKRDSIEDSESLSFKDVVFGALQSTGAIGTGLMLDFNFKTKMDDFRVAQISFSGDVRQ